MKNKGLFSSICLVASGTLVLSQGAFASLSCRDYYNSYVMEATTPAPVIVVAEPPHYRQHYPEYHDRYGRYDGHHEGHDGHHEGHDGHHDNSGDNSDDAFWAIVTLAGLTTTTAAEDAQLNDAENVMRIIDQAEMGDGPELRNFAIKVQTQLGSSIGVQHVASVVVRANDTLEFCAMGDLDTVDQLASRIANDIRNGY